MRYTKGLVASLMIAGAACLLGGEFPVGSAPAAAAPAASAEAEGVRVIFRDGRTVEGTLIEETATTVKVLVSVAGISAEAVDAKSDILEIERGLEAAAPSEDEEEDSEPFDKPRAADAGATSIYLLELEGGLGREITVSPLKRVLRDIKRHEPDILVVKIDMEFRRFGEDEAKHYENYFDQFFQCAELAPILTDDIERDSDWENKPKLVFWIRNAMGGIAFLPFNSPHIYYTSDARQGGVGYLDKIFEGVGDEVVREKQRSLRLGRAEGMAVRGGYNPVIIKAMTRSDYVLSYDMVGGMPVFYENSDRGQFLLTDDGTELNADPMQDIVRGRGNDVLQLDAEKAYRLGISDGTADTIQELVSLMGVARDYVLVDNKSERILEDWADGVDKAELNFRRLLGDFTDIEVQGDYQERTAARGQMIRLLKQMKSILDRYGEAIDPREIYLWPEEWDQSIEVIIEQIRNEQRLDGPP